MIDPSAALSESMGVVSAVPTMIVSLVTPGGGRASVAARETWESRRTLDVVLEENESGSSRDVSDGLVVDSGGDDVDSGNKGEAGDVGASKDLSVELESELNVSSADGDVTGVEQGRVG